MVYPLISHEYNSTVHYCTEARATTQCKLIDMQAKAITSDAMFDLQAVASTTDAKFDELFNRNLEHDVQR